MSNIFGAMLSLFGNKSTEQVPASIYDFEIASIAGDTIRFSAFKGKKILIVNTASFCGFTPQYEGLEKIYQLYGNSLVIVGVPSNDFLFQEPLSNKKIAEFCKVRFGVTFPLAAKQVVKGKNKHILYRWLTEKKYNGYADSDVKWNFQKYLIDENGSLVNVFPHQMPPDDPEIIKAIENRPI